jgi:hypothetical protein
MEGTDPFRALCTIAVKATLCYEPYMPASYNVDKDQRWVHTMLWGEVSLANLLGILERGLIDPQVDPSFSEIVDLTEVTHLNLSADDIRLIAQKSPFSVSSRRAFVVPDNDAVVGLVRMYEILREQLQGETGIRIFRTLDEALCWVTAKDMKPRTP